MKIKRMKIKLANEPQFTELYNLYRQFVLNIDYNYVVFHKSLWLAGGVYKVTEIDIKDKYNKFRVYNDKLDSELWLPNYIIAEVITEEGANDDTSIKQI